MSAEAGLVSLFSREEWEAVVGNLCRQAETAFRRQTKAPPGERRDVLRYGLLADQVRAAARGLNPTSTIELSPSELAVLDGGGPHHAWMYGDDDAHPLAAVAAVAPLLGAEVVAFEERRPFLIGEPPAAEAAAEVPVADVWHADGGDEGSSPPAMRARDAQRVLWDAQLTRACAGEDVPIVPSGITNSVLTEGLRANVTGTDRRDVRVVYRDGSEARRFPLGGLIFREAAPEAWPALRFSLMSMRHPDMDTFVDGALLRNRPVSRQRPAAETDELVYAEAVRKLDALVIAAGGGVTLRVYQTGLQPAVVGFYRAVTLRLIEKPGTLCVIPCYWRGNERYEEGTAWLT
jgi:hypothetical protein